MYARRIIVWAIVRIMVFVGWTMMDMRHVNVSASGLDVDAIIHRFVLIGAVTVVQPIRSMNACKWIACINHCHGSSFPLLPPNSICRCSDGKISPCIWENNSNAADVDGISQEDDSENNVLTILSTLIVVFIILIFLFGTAIYLLRYIPLSKMSKKCI